MMSALISTQSFQVFNEYKPLMASVPCYATKCHMCRMKQTLSEACKVLFACLILRSVLVLGVTMTFTLQTHIKLLPETSFYLLVSFLYLSLCCLVQLPHPALNVSCVHPSREIRLRERERGRGRETESHSYNVCMINVCIIIYAKQQRNCE